MKIELQQALFSQLKEILQHDQAAQTPVIMEYQPSFWSNLFRWGDQASMRSHPFTIALTGASGSGKSFIREVLVERLSRFSKVAAFTQDNYYRDFEADFPNLPIEHFYHEINLDDPTHLRFDHLVQDLTDIKLAPYGTSFGIPKLQFGTPTQKPTIIPNGLTLEVAPFIVTEGIHAFYDKATMALYDLKIYVDIEEETRRTRWLDRNRLENRGTTDNMWNTTVDCLKRYTLPTRADADVVINNNAAVEDVVSFIDQVVDSLLATALRHNQAA
jgi:uridine kinase